jgi:hypothetical protein
MNLTWGNKMWIIVIIVLLALCVFFSWFSTQVGYITDFFGANIFTLLALVSAAIAAFYFWISSKAYSDYKIKDKITKRLDVVFNPKNLPTKMGNKMELSKDDLPTKREIDLSTVDLQSLVGDMKQMLTSPTPLIFKGWGNRRLELDVERVRLMDKYIQNVIAAGQSFIRLKADSLISFDKIKLLANKELYELRKDSEGAEYDLKLLTEKYQSELIRYKTDKEKMILSVEREKAEIRLLNAQASQAEAIAKQESEKAETMKVATEEAEVRVAMIKVATGAIKFNELPQSFQTYIAITILNADTDKLSNFDIMERVKNSLIQQAQAEADRKTADADGVRADTELKFMKNDEARKKTGSR